MPSYTNIQDRNEVLSANPYIQAFRDARQSVSNALMTDKLNSFVDYGPILIDDPTYLGFKIEFGVWGASMMSNTMIAEMFRSDNDGENTYEQTKQNNVLLSDYDDYPMGLLNNYYQENGTNFFRWQTQSSYSAVNYLYHRNDDRRLLNLKTFIELLYDIQRDHPYVFSKISGISNLFKYSTERGTRLKDTIITIECLESVDMRVKTLMWLYRNVVWDDAYQRWILPDILRQFRMFIYVADMREFQLPVDFKTLESADHVEFPMFCLECAPCEFIIPGDILEDGYQSSFHNNQPTTKIQIKVKNVKIYERNEILGKFGDLFITDIYNARFRNDPMDETSPETIAKNWLHRDFFLNTYRAPNKYHTYERDAIPSINNSGLDLKGTDYYGNYAVPSSFIYNVHKWIYRHSIHNVLFYSGLGLGYDEAYGFIEKMMRKWFGYKPNEQEIPTDLGNDILSGGSVDSMLSDLRTKLKNYTLYPGKDKRDLQLYLKKLLKILKNDKMYYNNIIKSTNNDRSLATDLDNIPDTSGLKNLDTSFIPTKHDMFDISANDPSISMTEVKLADNIVNSSLQNVSLADNDPSINLTPTELQGGYEGFMRDVELVDNYVNIDLQPIRFPDPHIPVMRDVEITGKDPKINLEDPGLIEASYGVDLEDPGLEGDYNAHFIDVKITDNYVNPKLKPVHLHGRKPRLHIKDQGMIDNYVPTEMHDSSLAEYPYDIKLTDASLVMPENEISMLDVSLTGDYEGIEMQGMKLEGVIPNHEEIADANLYDNYADDALKNHGLVPNAGIETVADVSIDHIVDVPELSDVAMDGAYQKPSIEQHGLVNDYVPTEISDSKLVGEYHNVKLNDIELVSIEHNAKMKDVSINGSDLLAEFNDVEILGSKPDMELINQVLFNGYNKEEIKEVELVEPENKIELNDVVLTEPDVQHNFKNVELVETKEPAEIKEVALQETKPEIKLQPLHLSDAERTAIKIISVYLSEPDRVTNLELVNAIDGIIEEQKLLEVKLEEVAASMDLSRDELLARFNKHGLEATAPMPADVKQFKLEEAAKEKHDIIDSGLQANGTKPASMYGSEYISTATGRKMGSITGGGLDYSDSDFRSKATDRLIEVDERVLHQLEVRRQRADAQNND